MGMAQPVPLTAALLAGLAELHRAGEGTGRQGEISPLARRWQGRA